MNYERLKAQIEKGLYPSANQMQDSLDYALRRKIITEKQYEELTLLLENKEI